jgi:hypothetical protein
MYSIHPALRNNGQGQGRVVGQEGKLRNKTKIKMKQGMDWRKSRAKVNMVI